MGSGSQYAWDECAGAAPDQRGDIGLYVRRFISVIWVCVYNYRSSEQCVSSSVGDSATSGPKDWRRRCASWATCRGVRTSLGLSVPPQTYYHSTAEARRAQDQQRLGCDLYCTPWQSSAASTTFLLPRLLFLNFSPSLFIVLCGSSHDCQQTIPTPRYHGRRQPPPGP